MQILGTILNMSHFTCPSSPHPHYIFGPPTAFRATSAELGLDVLGEIELAPTVSRRGDRGWPAVMKGAEEEGSGEAEDEAVGRVREAFTGVAKEVWSKVT